MSLNKANDALRSKVSGQSAAVGPVNLVRGRMVAERGEALEGLQSLEVAAGKEHCEVRDSSKGAIGHLWSRVAVLFRVEAVRMYVHVDQAVHMALRESAVQNSVLHSKFSKAVGIVVPPVVDDTCKDPSFSAGASMKIFVCRASQQLKGALQLRSRRPRKMNLGSGTCFCLPGLQCRELFHGRLDFRPAKVQWPCRFNIGK